VILDKEVEKEYIIEGFCRDARLMWRCLRINYELSVRSWDPYNMKIDFLDRKKFDGQVDRILNKPPSHKITPTSFKYLYD
jgi:hypothetical protein